MKILLLIIFPFCLFAQKDCPKGYSFMPSLNSSSLIIEADMCLPDSICKRLWLEFNKTICEIGSSVSGSDNYYHSVISKWVNDSIGCQTKEVFQKKVGKKWIEISECLYYYENKNSISCKAITENKIEEIPCCGHVHKEKPL